MERIRVVRLGDVWGIWFACGPLDEAFASLQDALRVLNLAQSYYLAEYGERLRWEVVVEG